MGNEQVSASCENYVHDAVGAWCLERCQLCNRPSDVCVGDRCEAESRHGVFRGVFMCITCRLLKEECLLEHLALVRICFCLPHAAISTFGFKARDPCLAAVCGFP